MKFLASQNLLHFFWNHKTNLATGVGADQLFSFLNGPETGGGDFGGTENDKDFNFDFNFGSAEKDQSQGTSGFNFNFDWGPERIGMNNEWRIRIEKAVG